RAAPRGGPQPRLLAEAQAAEQRRGLERLRGDLRPDPGRSRPAGAGHRVLDERAAVAPTPQVGIDRELVELAAAAREAEADRADDARIARRVVQLEPAAEPARHLLERLRRDLLLPADPHVEVDERVDVRGLGGEDPMGGAEEAHEGHRTYSTGWGGAWQHP